MENQFVGSKYYLLLKEASEKIFDLERLYAEEIKGDFWQAREARYRLTDAENRIRHMFKVDELPKKS